MTSNEMGRRLKVAGFVAILSMALAIAAQAQGMFYKEIKKGDRIYVFNLAAEAERFEKSGETGKAITKLSAGPNGETVIADSEEALELFYFKNGIAAVVEKPKKPKAILSYKDGQTTAEFDKAQITFTNRLQLRMTDQIPDETVQLPGTSAKGDSKISFRIRRYEPQFSGWIYSKDLSYKLEFAFQDFQANTNAGGINDAYFNYDFTKGKKAFRLQFGQFKAPFGRQEMTSSFNLQFVDRSIVAGEYERGRDFGAQLDGVLLGTKLAWAVATFNGNARNQTANDNSKLQYDARVTFQPFGDVRYSEADFESTDKPLLAIAGQYDKNNFENTVAAPLPKVTACPCVNGGALSRETFGGDLVFKYKGLFVLGEYFNRTVTPLAAGAVEFKSNGYNVEAGYNLAPKRVWQLAFRYSSFDPTDLLGTNDRTEIGGGINYYYNKHFAKIAADFRQLEDKAKKTKDKEFRIQTQLYF